MDKHQEYTHLGLTGLSEFWPEKESLWLVSSSCMSQTDFENQVAGVVPYPWNHASLPAFHKEFQSCYDSCLVFLTAKLNQLHGVAYSKKYWNLVCGTWLFYFVNLVGHHYYSLKKATALLGKIKCIGLEEAYFITSLDNLDFIYEATDNLYNLQLYTELCAGMRIPIVERRAPKTEVRLAAASNPENVPCFRENSGKRLFNKILYKAGGFYYQKMGISRVKVLLKRSYFPKSFERKLTLRTLGRVFSHEGAWYQSKKSEVLQLDKRIELNGYACHETGLKHQIGLLLAKHVPKILIENYHDMLDFSDKHYARLKPKVILSTIAWHTDHAFAHFAGKMAAKGSVLVGGQHGGFFGIELNSQLEEHELKLTDYYLTWGWSDSMKLTCVPTPATRLVGSKKRKQPLKGTGILYVGTIAHRFSIIARPDFSGYSALQQQFFKALDPALIEEFKVRLHSADFGWNIKKNLLEVVDNIQLEDIAQISFSDSLRASRLYVCDHISTTFAEAFATNTPTILFWDPVFAGIRKEARQIFDIGRDVGFIQNTPEQAAAWVRTVYPNVEDWWFSSKTQAAVREFSDAFARTSEHPLTNWRQLLKGFTS